MDYILHCARGGFWFSILFLFIGVILWRVFRTRNVVYRHPMVGLLRKQHVGASSWYKRIFFVVRCLALFGLAIAILEPQSVDPRSEITVNGIDIMLVLDVSGSMQQRDVPGDDRSRFDIAKQEALRFIEKRSSDAMGLVLFGGCAISRCPLTLDKRVLSETIKELQLGLVDMQGTVLSTGIVTALNRLKSSQAKSKIMVLLTDGTPSAHDSDPAVALEAAKKLGVKIYTVGIGAESQEIPQSFWGMMGDFGVNKKLLSRIADETGGTFFMAHNADDMRTIYETIDQLEKSKQQMPLFSNYYDLGIPIVWGVLILLLLSLIVSATCWFGV